MNDGSQRISAVAISRDGIKGKISSPCGDSASTLRYTIDTVTQSLFSALDAASVRNPESTDYLMSPYKSFSSLLNNGIHLEHLHSYYSSRQDQSQGNNNGVIPRTLDIHVDAGIMIAMTTGYYSTESSTETYREDLYVQLPSGEVVRARTDLDALIILAGNAAAKWLSPVTGKPIRAIPHYLAVDNVDGTSRSWYGKMFLPPGNAKIPQSELTYSQFRQMEVAVSSLGSSSPTYNYHSLACDSDSPFEITAGEVSDCPSGEIYCWMRCQSVGSLPCGNCAVCMNTVTGQEEDPNTMCGSACKPGCLPGAQTSNNVRSNYSSSSSDFCMLPGVSMYMEGFTAISLKEEGTTFCVNLLFQEWTLDTSVKFGFACVGVFFLGILIQVLTFLRISESKRRNYYGETATSVITITLYGLQMVLGYFVMLVAMTYSVELFCMVCAGLVS